MSTTHVSAVDRAVSQARMLVASGKQPPGSRLPPERVLSENFRVSRATLRIALQALESSGLLECHSQRGWFVRDADGLADEASELLSFTELAARRGFTASSRLLKRTLRRATLDEAEALQIPPASEVIEVRRVRFLNAIPICLDESVLVAEYCMPVLEADVEGRSLFDVLESECGLSLFHSATTIYAEGARGEVAEALELELGAPVLICIARTIGSNGITLLKSRIDYRGDSYRFNADLYRR